MSSDENPNPPRSMRNPENIEDKDDLEPRDSLGTDSTAGALTSVGHLRNAPQDQAPIVDAEAVDSSDRHFAARTASETALQTGPKADEIIDTDIVDAESVESAQGLPESTTPAAAPPRVGTGYPDAELNTARGFNQQKLKSTGGAVGGLLIGVLSIAGAWLTAYSAINAIIGLLLSCWGVGSNAPRVAAAGIAASMIGAALSIFLGR